MDFQNDIGFYIKSINIFFDKQINAASKELNITRTQMTVLYYMIEHPKITFTPTLLEQAFSMSHPTIIGILRRLEQKDLVVITVNPKDRRGRIVELTEKSRSIQWEIEKKRGNIESFWSQCVCREEKDQLLAILKKVYGKIKEIEG